jgi:hypothetical protein
MGSNKNLDMGKDVRVTRLGGFIATRYASMAVSDEPEDEKRGIRPSQYPVEVEAKE